MTDTHDASIARNLRSKIRSTYRSDDGSAVKLTTLLAGALRNGDPRSISALGKFFGLSVSKTVQLDFDLVHHARLFINSQNAHNVENWIDFYKSAAPDCQMRSVYEKNLRNFVSAKRQLQDLKQHMNRTTNLAVEISLKYAALEQIFRSIRSERNL